jgi:DNA-binding transcriptional ArsR family regulator
MATSSKRKTPEMTLGALVAHPLRSQCLTLLAERTASPAELSVELGENLGNVSYHVRKLWKGGVIEIVEEKPVRGAMEHFYRATRIPLFDDEEIGEASLEDRETISRQVFSLAAANAQSAVVKRSDYHISRVPTRVDEEGWGEMRDLFEETLERIFEIQSKAADRLGESEDAGIPVIAFNTFFEMPERPKAD